MGELILAVPCTLLVLALLVGYVYFNKIKTKYERCSKVLQQTTDIVMMTDTNGIIQSVNDSFVNITGYSREEAIGCRPNILSSRKQDAQFYKKLWLTIKDGQPFSDVFINKTKAGEYYYEDKTITPIIENNVITGYISTGKDITSHIITKKRLNYLSTHDALTELPNRNFLINRADHAIDLSKKDGYKLAFISIELDNIDELNESLGISTGNQLLIKASNRLKRALYQEDTISRINETTFIVMIEKINSLKMLSSIADRLIEELDAPYAVDTGASLHVTASIGIALYPDDKTTSDDLIVAACSALRVARSENITTYRFYTPDINKSVVERLALLHDLKNALSNNEFRVHYQPQVDFRTGRIIGLEALLRWQHPVKGLMLPDKFIDILENNALMLLVGKWICRHVCEQIKAWQISGYEIVPVAVNLAPIQFVGGDLVKSIRESLQCFDLDPALYEVEITERVIMDNKEDVITALNELRDIGIKISLDDFGTGYSSLGYLKRFPLDIIKIDKTFIDDLACDMRDATIAKAIINMAHGMSMQVLAEGVENEKQLQYLKFQGCDAFQGYYFSKPVPAEAIDEYFKNNKCIDFSDIRIKPFRRLLIVDNDRNILRSLCSIVNKYGYEIYTANTIEDAFKLLATSYIDVIISDQRMSDNNGIEFLTCVKNMYPSVVRLLLTGYSDPNILLNAINRSSVYKFIKKPLDEDDLRACLADAFDYADKINSPNQIGQIRTSSGQTA